MYLSTFQVLWNLYLSTDVLKYKVLLPGSGLRYVMHYECPVPEKKGGESLSCNNDPSLRNDFSCEQFEVKKPERK